MPNSPLKKFSPHSTALDLTSVQPTFKPPPSLNPFLERIAMSSTLRFALLSLQLHATKRQDRQERN